MKPLPSEDDLTAAFEQEKERQEQQEIEDAKIRWEEHQQASPDVWSPEDLRRGKRFLPKLEGFLANDQMWRRGEVSIVAGPSGVFKTWIVIVALWQITKGGKFAGMEMRKGRALFFSEEMAQQSITGRTETLWDEKEDAVIGRDLVFSFHPDFRFDFFDRKAESEAKFEDIWKRAGEPGIVAIDALVNIHTGDENSNRDMSKVLNAFVGLARKLNICILIIHHTGKAGEYKKGADRLRGATVIRDIVADIAIVDAAPKSTAGIRRSIFEFYKTRNLETPMLPFTFQLDPHRDDPRRREMTFDLGVAESEKSSVDPAMIERLRVAVEELAGDGEVLKEALREHLFNVEQWGRRRFEETLQAARVMGRIARKTRGKNASFYIPRVDEDAEEPQNEVSQEEST